MEVVHSRTVSAAAGSPSFVRACIGYRWCSSAGRQSTHVRDEVFVASITIFRPLGSRDESFPISNEGSKEAECRINS